MTTMNDNIVASDAGTLTNDELNAVSGGLTFKLFGYEFEFEKDAVTVCGPDKCVRVTSKSVVTF